MSVAAADSSHERANADHLQARWRMLLLLVACRCVLGLQFQTLGSVSVPLGAELGFGAAQVGTLIGLFMLPGVVLAVRAGMAGRRISDRWLVTAGLGALALGGGVASIAAGFEALADRIGRADTILHVCLATAVACMLLWPSGLSPGLLALAFGRLRAAPAGIIVEPTGQTMAANHRAFGMGLFLSAYDIIVAPAPALAGWLVDRTGSNAAAMTLAAALFALAAAAHALFRGFARSGAAR